MDPSQLRNVEEPKGRLVALNSNYSIGSLFFYLIDCFEGFSSFCLRTFTYLSIILPFCIIKPYLYVSRTGFSVIDKLYRQISDKTSSLQIIQLTSMIL